MKFTKMHGLGNDYVYVNCFAQQVGDPVSLARIISDRHRGVGSDGLILIRPSDRADVRMEMYNADGSRAQMCGNGIRCVARYAFEHQLGRGQGPRPAESGRAEALRIAQRMLAGASVGSPDQIAALSVETDAGVKDLVVSARQGRVQMVCVDMGRPSLRPADLPATLPGEALVDRPVPVEGGAPTMTCVSVGNPHAVLFVDNVRSVDLVTEGKRIENAPVFPERINVHFVQIEGRSEVTLVTWERGSGITQACGTGATAVCVAGAVTGRTERTILAHLPGGDLHLNWAADDHVYMTGPATEVFSGEWPD
jgi:diaminopimelate epimerase